MKIEDITQEMIQQRALENSYDWPLSNAYEAGFESAIEWFKEKLKEA